MMARPAISHQSGLKTRIDQSTAASKRALNEHMQLAAELAAIQEELERRVSLGSQHKGLPWTKDKPRS